MAHELRIRGEVERLLGYLRDQDDETTENDGNDLKDRDWKSTSAHGVSSGTSPDSLAWAMKMAKRSYLSTDVDQVLDRYDGVVERLTVISRLTMANLLKTRVETARSEAKKNYAFAQALEMLLELDLNPSNAKVPTGLDTHAAVEPAPALTWEEIVAGEPLEGEHWDSWDPRLTDTSADGTGDLSSDDYDHESAYETVDPAGPGPGTGAWYDNWPAREPGPAALVPLKVQDNGSALLARLRLSRDREKGPLERPQFARALLDCVTGSVKDVEAELDRLTEQRPTDFHSVVSWGQFLADFRVDCRYSRLARDIAGGNLRLGPAGVKVVDFPWLFEPVGRVCESLGHKLARLSQSYVNDKSVKPLSLFSIVEDVRNEIAPHRLILQLFGLHERQCHELPVSDKYFLDALLHTITHKLGAADSGTVALTMAVFHESLELYLHDILQWMRYAKLPRCTTRQSARQFFIQDGQLLRYQVPAILAPVAEKIHNAGESSLCVEGLVGVAESAETEQDGVNGQNCVSGVQLPPSLPGMDIDAAAQANSIISDVWSWVVRADRANSQRISNVLLEKHHLVRVFTTLSQVYLTIGYESPYFEFFDSISGVTTSKLSSSLLFYTVADTFTTLFPQSGAIVSSLSVHDPHRFDGIDVRISISLPHGIDRVITNHHLAKYQQAWNYLFWGRRAYYAASSRFTPSQARLNCIKLFNIVLGYNYSILNAEFRQLLAAVTKGVDQLATTVMELHNQFITTVFNRLDRLFQWPEFRQLCNCSLNGTEQELSTAVADVLANIPADFDNVLPANLSSA